MKILKIVTQNKKKLKKKKFNLRGKPYSLRDGDALVLIDERMSESKDDNLLVQPEPQRGKNYGKDKKQKTSFNKDMRHVKPPEPVLKINVDI